MKLKNKTQWNAQEMKRLFCRCIKEYNKQAKTQWGTRLMVEVLYGRSTGYSGYAYYLSNYICLRVPHIKIESVPLAKLFIHELEHTEGMRHKDTTPFWGKDEDTITGIFKLRDWANQYPITAVIVPEKPKQDLQLKRYNHVLKLVEKKKQALKRVQNQLRKWTQRKRYYERTLVAAGKLPEEEM